VQYSESYSKNKDTGIPWVSVIFVLKYEACVVAICNTFCFQPPEMHNLSFSVDPENDFNIHSLWK
jgi:hypothetical protein